jgi:putative sterol carrier protein
MVRAKPPKDITPDDFFTRWVPEAVAGDEERRRKLGATEAAIVFHLSGEGGGDFCVRIRAGDVTGETGAPSEPNLRVRVDVDTWRMLNAGEITAPEALLRRRIKLEGDFILGLKLHLLLGP